MAMYHKIQSYIHHDERFLKLTDDGKLTLFLVFLHPNLTALGAMRSTTQGLAAEFGWDHARLLAAMNELATVQFVDWDPKTGFISFPDQLTPATPLFNGPTNANQIAKAWLNALTYLPECGEKRQLIMRGARYL